MQDETLLPAEKSQNETIEELAGCNYTPEEIAMYLDIPTKEFMHIFNDEGSQFRYHYERGILIAKASVDMETLISAKAGNMTAAQRLDKIQQRKQFEQLKQQMINGES